MGEQRRSLPADSASPFMISPFRCLVRSGGGLCDNTVGTPRYCTRAPDDIGS